MESNFGDKVFAASAYLFGVPALYIILTEHRKKKFLGEHGARAFLLWLTFIFVFFALRFVIDSIWVTNFVPQLERVEPAALLLMATYLLYRGVRCFT